MNQAYAPVDADRPLPRSRGLTGVIVPPSNPDGSSTAFSPEDPGAVIVDPDQPGGGFAVDLKAVATAAAQDVLARVGKPMPKEQDKIFAIYQALAAQAAADAAKLQSPPPVPAIVPTPVPSPAIIQPVIPRPAASAPLTAVPSLPTSADAGLEALLLSIYERQTQLLARQAAATQAPSHVSAPPPAPAPVSSTAAPDVHPIGLPAFDPAKVMIPFLTAAPSRPKYQVYADLGLGGRFGARFHAVVVCAECLVLVYDTRYEDGTQWLPPVLGEGQSFRVDVAAAGSEPKRTFQVNSFGLDFELGCLAFSVLVLAQNDTAGGDTEVPSP